MARRIEINNVAYTFSDLAFKFGSTSLGISTDIPSLQDISWGVDVDRKTIHGRAQLPLATTSGPITFDPLTMTMFTQTWAKIKAACGGISVLATDVPLSTIITLNKEGTADSFTWAFVGYYKTEKTSLKVGSDANFTQLTFNIISVPEFNK